MKPKNAAQREVVALSAALPTITDRQKQWALDHCFARTAFYSKGQAWCSHCGKHFPVEHTSELIAGLAGGKVTCPHCGTPLTLKNSSRRKHSETWYYTVVTTCKGWQVCRNFVVEKFVSMGEEPFHAIHEVVQNWISPTGHEEVIARPVRLMAYIYDAWNFCKPMELRDCYRDRCDCYHSSTDKYRVRDSWVYPHHRLLPPVRRNGYTARCTALPQSELIKLLLTDREAEMLVKTRQFSILVYKYNRGYREFCLPFAHAIRVANRNRYIVRDASLWFDYLELLDHFGLDTHNAHYVCPRRLKAGHDILLRRKRRIEAREEAEREIRTATEWEKKYRADKGRFFGISFGNGDITVSVIQSVADMAEEGKAIHHCVYDNGYYKKPDSLILSARQRNGKRLETVEVSLRTFSVVQSRAKCNGTSARHDEILALVRRNMDLIKQAM